MTQLFYSCTKCFVTQYIRYRHRGYRRQTCTEYRRQLKFKLTA